MSTQILTCRNCDHVWQRKASRGRPPVFCDTCRQLGRSLTGEVREIAPKVEAHHPSKHYAFATLLQVAKARVPAMLVGPAGSGKSTAGRQVAEILDLEFTTESCSPHMTKWDIMGFVGPNGNYVAGVLRKAFEFGGVVLLDEIDASNPAVLVSINLLASVRIGETVTFPDGASVARHENFVLIAGANTYGDGASSEYVGREQLDAATLDRFAVIAWGYDERLEFHAAGPDSRRWVEFVQMVRKAAADAQVEMMVTPRASIQGAELLRSGMDAETVAELVIWKGISADAKRSVIAAGPDAMRVSA